MALRSSLHSVSFSLLLVACVSTAPGGAAEADGFRVTVEGDHAVLSFPIPPTDALEWYQAQTRPGALEYAWYMEVDRGGDAAFQVGFFLFNSPLMDTSRGALGDLLRAGQTSVSVREGRRARRLEELRLYVEAEALEGAVVVRLEGEAFERVFAGRPRSVTLHAVWPGAPAVERRVRVEYLGEGG